MMVMNLFLLFHQSPTVFAILNLFTSLLVYVECFWVGCDSLHTKHSGTKVCAVAVLQTQDDSLYCVANLRGLFFFKQFSCRTNATIKVFSRNMRNIFLRRSDYIFQSNRIFKKKQRYEFVFFYSTKCVLEFVGKRFLVCRL